MLSLLKILATLHLVVAALSVSENIDSYSGVETGKASYLHFPENVNRHVKYHENIHNGVKKNIKKVQDSTTALAHFWKAHGSYFGVSSNDLTVTKVFRDSSNGVKHYHYSQVIDGYKVYGGDMVVTLSSLNEVISANGHPLPRNNFNHHVDITQEQLKENSIEVMDTTSKYINANYPLENDHYVCKAAENVLDVRAEWYRSDIHLGGEGDVNLAYHVSGQCNAAASKNFIKFDAFYDAATGKLLNFIDKTDRIMSKEMREKFRKDGMINKNNNKMNAEHTNSLKSSLRTSRKLDLAPELSIMVYDYNTNVLLYNEDTDAMPTDNQINWSVNYTIGTTRMMRALTNQQWLSYKQAAATLEAYVHYDDFNAYYSGASITVGEGLAVDDVLAHEWIHGYTDFSSNLEYSYLSGALNEGMSDIFGEGYDILVNNDQPLTYVPRNSNPTCTSYDWTYRSLPMGTDNSYRWLMGEEITQTDNPSGLYALRDMYKPECFGNPSTTYSDDFFCGTGDNGGVHYNSGVPNRLFAVLVDGGVFEHPGDGTTLTIQPIGMTKALNLMWATQLQMVSTSQFKDFGNILKTQCRAKMGSNLYEPNPHTGETIVSPDVLIANDCDNLDNAVFGSGLLRDYDEICPPEPSEAPTPRPDGLNRCNVANQHWVGDGWCDKSGGYNTRKCGYDGGDCCEETCVDNTYTCGSGGYKCRDPAVLNQPTHSPTKKPIPNKKRRKRRRRRRRRRREENENPITGFIKKVVDGAKPLANFLYH
eukprot:TRINITY_DN66524_c1_g1_i2.p1 TRINITY_DN66524_c1_g1~~TRINITY_DN66524_c1_g1_i2.p1  ORF type:complete len:760 (-),score=-13.87 TRINITY_DN66524_c1_g1_i2:162-2441(-)